VTGAALAWGWAAAVASVSAAAVWRRARARPPAPGRDARPVVLARPCAGDEPGLEARLAAMPRSRVPVAVRITVARSADRAPSMEAAAARLRAAGVDARVLVVPTDAPNRKAGQLAGLAATLGDVLLVSADADVDLAGFDLDALVDPLRDGTSGGPDETTAGASEAAPGGAPRGPGSPALGATWAPPAEAGAARRGASPALGATWAPPAEVGGSTWADRASGAVLGGSLHAFPLLAGLDPGGLVGKVFAARLDRVRRAGGLEALCAYVGEDMELARRLRRAGFATAAVPGVARACPPAGRTWGAVVERYGRWLAVIRRQRPALLASYPLLFAATGPLVALALAVAAPGAAALAVGARLAVAVAARRAAALPSRPAAPFVDAVLADVLLWAALCRALASRRVTWRGRVVEGGA
jgi:ceramide glucosyltransferase